MRGAFVGLVALCAAVGLVAGEDAWARSSRYGIEGKIVRFDGEKDVLVVEVLKTKVSGGAGTGRVAGEEAPDPIRSGQELSLQVVPEGSVLKRTVVKSIQGGGLNNAGTRESFVSALEAIPDDRPVIFSFEKGSGDPPWLLKMIQIRMTEEELEARLEEITAD